MIWGQAVKGKKKTPPCTPRLSGGVPYFLAHLVEVQVEPSIEEKGVKRGFSA